MYQNEVLVIMEGEDDVRIRWKALEQEDLDHGNPLGMGGWVKG